MKRPRECYWCHKPLNRKDYKKYQTTGLSVCEKCDKQLDVMSVIVNHNLKELEK